MKTIPVRARLQPKTMLFFFFLVLDRDFRVFCFVSTFAVSLKIEEINERPLNLKNCLIPAI